MIDSAAAHSNRSVIPCGEEEGPAAVVAAVTASRALSSCTSVVRASESLPLSTWAYVAARDRGSPDGDDGQPGHRIWARGVGGMVTVGSGVVGREDVDGLEMIPPARGGQGKDDESCVRILPVGCISSFKDALRFHLCLEP